MAVAAGRRRPAPETANALARLIEARGLGARIDWLGEVSAEALDGVYDFSDIFVSSSLYEGYGMALAEALARGLPIVTTTGGACADTAPDGAALKVAPGDVGALREALRRIIEDRELRRDLSEGLLARRTAIAELARRGANDRPRGARHRARRWPRDGVRSAMASLA